MQILEKITAYLAAALLAAFTLIILVDVVFRYVLKIPLSWPAESSVLLFQWTVFLGAPLAVRRRRHFGLDLIVRRMPPGVRRAAEGFALVTVAASSVLLVVLGLDMARRTWPSMYATLPLSHGVAYLGIPVSAALMLVFSLEYLGGFVRPRGGAGAGE